MATPQMLGAAELDFVIFDHLTEITVAILVWMWVRDATQGHTADVFSAAMAFNLAVISGQGGEVISGTAPI